MPDNSRVGQTNPQIRDVEVGIKDLRTIKMYPLSVRDQLAVVDLLSGAINTFFAAYEDGEAGNIAFAQFVSLTIRENLDTVINMAFDVKEAGEDILSDMTNLQLETIIKGIYEVNYSFLAKSLRNLLEQAESKTGTPLMTSFRKSVPPTEDIN